MSTGRYIALEGAEGCGKSTHAALLARDLDAVLTRETGGTNIGRRIREILHDTATTGLAARAEALLTAADRAQHMHEVVLPALSDGRHVVSDRSVYSTLAYQGYGRLLAVDEVRSVNDWAIEGTWPDLAIFIDVDPSVLAQRLRGRTLDRFELEDEHFHTRVREGFRAMATAEAARWAVVDGNLGPDRVAVEIRRVVRDRCGI
jgi:dTMP kinase